MPIFTDKKNELLAIILTAILLFGIFIFLIYQVSCNKEGIKIGNFEMSPGQVIEKKEGLKEKSVEFNEQINLMNEILKEELPCALKNRIAKLIYIRRKDINKAEELLRTFEQFNELSYGEQVDFMKKVIRYFSKKINPSRYIDYSKIAKEIITTNKMGILMADTKEKDKEIEGLKKQIAQLKKDKGEIESLYAQAEKIIKQNKLDMGILRKDSITNVSILASLNSQNASLKKEKKKLEKEMESYNLIRIKNCSFIVPNCRSQKKGAYLLGCMKSIELKFVANYNIPPENKSEIVRIVFTLPTTDPSKNLIKKRIVKVKIGEETKVLFNEPNYKFIEGFYTVQIFYDKTSTIIPLEIKNLRAKKWISK